MNDSLIPHHMRGLLFAMKQIERREAARVEALKLRQSAPAGLIYFDQALAGLLERRANASAEALRKRLADAVFAGRLVARSARDDFAIMPGTKFDEDDCLVSIDSLRELTGQDLTPQHAKGKRWTDDEVAELAAYKNQHGTKKAAKHFSISEALVRKKCNSGQPAPKALEGRIHRIR